MAGNMHQHQHTFWCGNLLQEAGWILSHGADETQSCKEGKGFMHWTMEHELPALTKSRETFRAPSIDRPLSAGQQPVASYLFTAESVQDKNQRAIGMPQ
jgi:hypothetical protein